MILEAVKDNEKIQKKFKEANDQTSKVQTTLHNEMERN